MKNTSGTKQKYNIEIADVQLTILSDESEEFVRDTVSRLDSRIRTLTVQNKRCAKIDAALLCALDSLGEKIKLEKKIKNLEAQISLYEVNLRRLRGESPAEKAEAETPTEHKPTEKAEKPAPEAAKPASTASADEEKESAKPKKAPAKRKSAQQLTMEDSIEKTAKEEPQSTAAEEAAPPVLQKDKLQQIETLLRRRSDSEQTDAAAQAKDPAKNNHDDKLRQIEELLRMGGQNRTLSEALEDAQKN